MEIEFFDEEKHDCFLDEYKKYSREPSDDEKEFFKPLLEELVSEIAEVTGISTDFKLYFAMTNESQFDDDTPINRYIHGFSFASWMEGFKEDVVMIRAVKDRKHWKDCLINILAHEMAHQEFYNNKTAPYTNLENIIFEGHAMNRAEQVAQEMGLTWKPHYRSEEQIKIDGNEILEVLDEDRTYQPSNIFQNGDKPCEEAEGYNIAYQIVKKINSGKKLSLDDFTKVKDEDLREEVRAGIENILK